MISDLLMAAASQQKPLSLRPTSSLPISGNGYLDTNAQYAYDKDLNTFCTLTIGNYQNYNFTKVFQFPTPIFLKKLKIKLANQYESNAEFSIRINQIFGGQPVQLLSEYNVKVGQFNVQTLIYDVNKQVAEIEFYKRNWLPSIQAVTNIYDIVGET